MKSVGRHARELAQRRLRRLLEPTPEQLAAEIEEARKEGYQVIQCEGGISVWIKKYTEDTPGE